MLVFHESMRGTTHAVGVFACGSKVLCLFNVAAFLRLRRKNAATQNMDYLFCCGVRLCRATTEKMSNETNLIYVVLGIEIR
jgi:hypothetical protein